MNRKTKRFLRNLTVLIVVLLGTLLALPTFFPVDPMLQVANEDGTPLDASDVAAIDAALDEPVTARLETGVVRLRFESIDAQLRAKDALETELPGTVIAFNLRPRLPRWIEVLGLEPVTLGLDLRGGVHFVYEVDLESVERHALETERDAVRSALREAGVRAESRIAGGAIEVELYDAADADEARGALLRLSAPGPYEWRLGEPPTGEPRSALRSARTMSRRAASR